MAKASLNPNASVVPTVTLPPSAPPSAFAGMVPVTQTQGGFTSQESGSYIVFVHQASPKYKDILAAHRNIREGDAVLIQANGPILALDPFRCILVPTYYECAIKYDNMGKVQEVSEDLNLVAQADRKDNERWKSAAETILLVFTDDGIKSCRCTFKEVKINAFIAGKQGLIDASTSEDWRERSAAHTTSIGTPYPFMRTILTITMKNGKSAKGYSYSAANGTSAVISDANDYVALASWMSSMDEQNEARATIKAHEDRIRQLKGLIK